MDKVVESTSFSTLKCKSDTLIVSAYEDLDLMFFDGRLGMAQP